MQECSVRPFIFLFADQKLPEPVEPHPVRNMEKIRKALLGLKEFQKSHSSGDANIQGLIEEGRKD